MNNYVLIDFYKTTGKWYAADVVDMENVEPWNDPLIIVQQIRKRQTALRDGFEGYIAVLRDTPANFADPDYEKTWNMLIHAAKMDHIRPPRTMSGLPVEPS
jgi:hypothetical protein